MAFSVGSIFCATLGAAKCIEAKEYLVSFFGSVNELNRKSVAIGTLKDIALSFIFILMSAFFKAGIIFNYAVIIRRGFVMGFTLSAFFKILGMKGLLVNLIILPEMLILVPSLLFFSSTSTKISILPTESKKKFLGFFIIFSVIFGTIFCGYAFFNGYLTTTFMKLPIFKI